MSNERERLAALLLDDPFDTSLRLEFAALLFAEGEFETALKQTEILKKQAVSAPVLVLAARCLSRLERMAEAKQDYLDAREMSGFTADEEFERMMVPAEPARLTLVPPTSATVTSLPAVPREKVDFSTIGGMDALKKTLRMNIVEPFLRPSLFAKFKKQAGGGILLFGPPGCGKTLIARAIAAECGATFIHVGISEILTLWLGESERNLARVFEDARQAKPSVLFFDEIDALAFSRSKSRSDTMRTIVNEFLAQLDGFDHNNREVMILAATNMPWDVDPAMKRPGRLSRQIFVPPPDMEARMAILQLKLQDVPTVGINYKELARKTEVYSGADLDGVIERAKERVLEEILSGAEERPIAQADLEFGVEQTPSTTRDWLRTVGTLLKYADDDPGYKDVKAYLKQQRLH